MVRLRKKKFDSLSVTTEVRSTIEFSDTLFFQTNNPIVKIDTSKVFFVDKDTVKIAYEPFISKTESKIGFLFDKKYKKQYALTMFPEAVEDIFNQSWICSCQSNLRNQFANLKFGIESRWKKGRLFPLESEEEKTPH